LHSGQVNESVCEKESGIENSFENNSCQRMGKADKRMKCARIRLSAFHIRWQSPAAIFIQRW
jgi:hypothetical protein